MIIYEQIHCGIRHLTCRYFKYHVYKSGMKSSLVRGWCECGRKCRCACDVFRPEMSRNNAVPSLHVSHGTGNLLLVDICGVNRLTPLCYEFHNEICLLKCFAGHGEINEILNVNEVYNNKTSVFVHIPST
jgi:hypothetical protein